MKFRVEELMRSSQAHCDALDELREALHQVEDAREEIKKALDPDAYVGPRMAARRRAAEHLVRASKAARTAVSRLAVVRATKALWVDGTTAKRAKTGGRQ